MSANEELKALFYEWNKCEERSRKMADLMTKFMDAETLIEVTDIMIENHVFMDENPQLYLMVRTARRRIRQIEALRREVTPISEMN